jgi:hypothetical protein
MTSTCDWPFHYKVSDDWKWPTYTIFYITTHGVVRLTKSGSVGEDTFQNLPSLNEMIVEFRRKVRCDIYDLG